MNIEVHQPKLEALLQQRMASGEFESVEDMLLRSLGAAVSADTPVPDESARSGAELIAAMQAMPYKDVAFEHSRLQLPVRDIEL